MTAPLDKRIAKISTTQFILKKLIPDKYSFSMMYLYRGGINNDENQNIINIYQRKEWTAAWSLERVQYELDEVIEQCQRHDE